MLPAFAALHKNDILTAFAPDDKTDPVAMPGAGLVPALSEGPALSLAAAATALTVVGATA